LWGRMLSCGGLAIRLVVDRTKPARSAVIRRK
jgi:hypothetical protein